MDQNNVTIEGMDLWELLYPTREEQPLVRAARSTRTGSSLPKYQEADTHALATGITQMLTPLDWSMTHA